jgi:hypothetical protein
LQFVLAPFLSSTRRKSGEVDSSIRQDKQSGKNWWISCIGPNEPIGSVVKRESSILSKSDVASLQSQVVDMARGISQLSSELNELKQFFLDAKRDGSSIV